MIVINPISIDESKIVSSTIPEPDASQGEILWVAGTYNTGEQRVEDGVIYQVTADPSTTDQPSVGAAKAVPTWVAIAPSNRLAMFDNVISTKSKGGTSLVVELDPNALVNGVAGFGISGASLINITMTDPVEGVVYNTDVPMIDNEDVVDWYYYFFSPIIQASRFVLLDLPTFQSATITMTVTGDDIQFGDFVIGQQVRLGVANHGTSLQLLDFSRKETDDFGNISVTKGRNSRLVDYDVTIEKSRVNYVFNTLSALTTIPSVWVGAEDSNDPTLVFGYYRDFQVNIATPTLTDATIQVEGLV